MAGSSPYVDEIPSGPRVICEQLPHPELDVMLLGLGPIHDDVSCPTSLELMDDPIDASWIGRYATLAGRGLTEAGEHDELRFVRSPIVQVDATELWVDGSGDAGACLGDSGGPLLVEGEGGVPRVAGVLTRGSSSCVDRDAYARADTLAPWVRATTAGRSPCAH
jgi:hypothetical protein